MHSLTPIIFIVIALALMFDFINGFHDTANAIATSIGTKVLTPFQALGMSAVLNFIGAMLHTEVAKTIGSGIAAVKVAPNIIAMALIGAIIWNLITWYFAIPSSSSHALVGALIGATITSTRSFSTINWSNFLNKIIVPLVTAPVIGLIFGFIFMFILTWLFHKASHKKVNGIFKKLQICSAMLMSYSHGSNDAQKSMGIITMALVAGGVLVSKNGDFPIPIWVKLICAIAMALGTMSGGWKIIKTMGVNMIKLEPIDGFAAETGAALTIQVATFLGDPVSTTHIITSSIMGVGACKRLSAVRWSLAKTILVAWVLTIPCSALISSILTLIFIR
jgi:PiT family inorganic phosphate transporter